MNCTFKYHNLTLNTILNKNVNKQRTNTKGMFKTKRPGFYFPALLVKILVEVLLHLNIHLKLHFHNLQKYSNRSVERFTHIFYGEYIANHMLNWQGGGS